MTHARPALLEKLCARILALTLEHPARVGIDGVDAAGKTTLADDLASALREQTERPVLRASLDRFHQPREARYRRGPDSPEGYYEDSFDLPALRAGLLDPLGPGGSRRVQLERFDFQTNTGVESGWIQVAPAAILLFDGVFLQRPQLAGCWDLTLFLQVDFQTVLARAVVRDAALMGGEAAVRQRYQARYLPAQQTYLDACRPLERADIVIDSNDPLDPILIR